MAASTSTPGSAVRQVVPAAAVLRGDTILRGETPQRVVDVRAGDRDDIAITFVDTAFVYPYLPDDAIELVAARRPLRVIDDPDEAQRIQEAGVILVDGDEGDGRAWHALVVPEYGRRPPVSWVVRGTDPVDH